MRAGLHSPSFFCDTTIVMLLSLVLSVTETNLPYNRVNYLYTDLILGHRLRIQEHIIFHKSKPASLFNASFTISR